MPAFQDFGPLSERRRIEKQYKQRKKIIVATLVIFTLLLLVSVATIAIVRQERRGRSTKPAKSSSGNLFGVSKSVETICHNTDYRKKCVASLLHSLKHTKTEPHPRDLVRNAISAISVEMTKALSKAESIRSNDPMVVGAIDDCKELFHQAMDELNSTVNTIMRGHHLKAMSKKAHDLKNWLSAVVSYQQTCVDGFPKGELRTRMKHAVLTSRELTSNALAIVGQASSILSVFNVKGLGFRRRRLMTAHDDLHVDDDGMPSWLPEEDRRILKQRMEKKLKPNVVVAKDGSGDFKTITDALAAMPKKYKGRYVIYVKAGVYKESPKVTKKMENVTMYGDGSRKTIVTGSKNFVDGTRTFQTATFAAVGVGFMAISMGFENTAGAIKHQAVALRVQSDKSIFLNCRMDGYQDTLYAQTHRQFYRSCVMSGTVDFIFGDAAAVFQNCKIIVRRPLDNQKNIVTAQGRADRRESTGFVIQACRFIPEGKLVADAGTNKIKTYLARPWKEYSRTIIMESTIGGFVHPDGYLPWDGDFALKTLYYGEYNNKGQGASTTKRVKWPGVRKIKRMEALQYTAKAFIQGGEWIKKTGSTVRLGLYD